MFTLLKIHTLFYILQNSPRKGDLVDIHTHPSPSITYKTCNINQLKKKTKTNFTTLPDITFNHPSIYHNAEPKNGSPLQFILP